MDMIMNAIKQLSNLENTGKVHILPCIIQHYDPTLYRVKVLLSPDDVETGWVPLASWGEIMPPVIGTQATILFLRGNINNAVVIGNVFSRLNPPPQDPEVTKPGSFLLKTSKGTSIKVTDDGQLEINAVAGQAIKINSGQFVYVGDDAQSFQRLVKETIKDLYNQHTHPANGQPPAIGFHITDVDLTKVLKGN